jgi:mycofactocin precursor
MTTTAPLDVVEHDEDEPEVVTEETLVEEVSIDGMCGVY